MFGIDLNSFLLGIPIGVILVGVIYFVNIVLRVNKKHTALRNTLRRMLGKEFTEILNEEWDEIEGRNKELSRGIDKVIIH